VNRVTSARRYCFACHATRRNEGPGDKKAIRRLNTAAFGQPQEAELVDALRDYYDDVLSLVAVDGDDIVGHILFSPAIINDVAGKEFGPMAVAPERQRGGIGSELIGADLAKLPERGCPFVIVLGHPEY
jgi:putative acetyltransferase